MTFLEQLFDIIALLAGKQHVHMPTIIEPTRSWLGFLERLWEYCLTRQYHCPICSNKQLIAPSATGVEHTDIYGIIPSSVDKNANLNRELLTVTSETLTITKV